MSKPVKTNSDSVSSTKQNRGHDIDVRPEFVAPCKTESSIRYPSFHDPVLERPATLKQRFFRVIVSFLGAETIPSAWRVKAMRWLGCDISPDVKAIWAGSIFKSNDLVVESGAFINTGFYFDGMATLLIGKNVAIGPRVTVITGSHELGEQSLLRCSLHAKKEPVTIGDGCWIGAGTTILPGITIARGCVIGAGSIVTHSTIPDGLYLGAPARRIRDLPT